MKENSIKNERSSIKEDIKVLEEMIENANIENMDMNDCFGGEHIEAIEHILSDYKRVLEINEVLLKENEELKEYKKIAELTKISCCTAQNCEALNNAIKSELENQKLKKELNDINQKWIQKIKDKIEGIQEEGYWLFTTDRDSDKCVEVLQELLEGRK